MVAGAGGWVWVGKGEDDVVGGWHVGGWASVHGRPMSLGALADESGLAWLHVSGGLRDVYDVIQQPRPV